MYVSSDHLAIFSGINGLHGPARQGHKRPYCDQVAANGLESSVEGPGSWNPS